jgi:hypothetical protein
MPKVKLLTLVHFGKVNLRKNKNNENKMKEKKRNEKNENTVKQCPLKCESWNWKCINAIVVK